MHGSGPGPHHAATHCVTMTFTAVYTVLTQLLFHSVLITYGPWLVGYSISVVYEKSLYIFYSVVSGVRCVCKCLYEQVHCVCMCVCVCVCVRV